MTNDDFIKNISTVLSSKFDAKDISFINSIIKSHIDGFNINKESLFDIDKCRKDNENLLIVYLSHMKIQGLSENTLILYKRIIINFINYIKKPFSDVDEADINYYLYNYKSSYNIGNKTLEMIRGTLSSFFTWCVNENYLSKNPVLLIKPIKYEKPKRGYLSEYEIELLRNSCESKRDRALIELFYSTGCRVSEIVELNKNDINFDNMEITVHGKGDKYRTVFINVKCKLALEDYFKCRVDLNDAVIVSDRKPHNRITRRNIEYIIDKLGEKAGIERHVYPHLIRHTTATHALQSGVPVEYIQEILGHDAPSTTLIYASVDNSKIKESHNKYII